MHMIVFVHLLKDYLHVTLYQIDIQITKLCKLIFYGQDNHQIHDNKYEIVRDGNIYAQLNIHAYPLHF